MPGFQPLLFDTMNKLSDRHVKRTPQKTLLQLKQVAPVVEVRLFETMGRGKRGEDTLEYGQFSIYPLTK